MNPTQEKNNNYVAILAGGIGSRFWPLSKPELPKQFLDILDTGETLIQATYNRFAKFIPASNIFIVTATRYRQIVREQLPFVKDEQIVCEPSRKNTATCVAYISFKLHQQNPKANLICAPADHLIQNDTAFIKVCWEALGFTASHSALLTLGIKPTNANTGYGYIQYEKPSVSDNVYKVKTFTEKPNLELAKIFIASGDFLWNSGIFIWRTEHILKAFQKYMPEHFEVFDEIKPALNTTNEQMAIEKAYPLCTSISIDYGILEKANNVYLIPSDFGWSDLGTWGSVYDNLPKDYLENAVRGNEIVLFESTKNIVHSSTNKQILIQGLNGFIIVNTEDKLLICRKENEQNIKEYLAEIKRNRK